MILLANICGIILYCVTRSVLSMNAKPTNFPVVLSIAAINVNPSLPPFPRFLPALATAAARQGPGALVLGQKCIQYFSPEPVLALGHTNTLSSIYTVCLLAVIQLAPMRSYHITPSHQCKRRTSPPFRAIWG